VSDDDTSIGPPPRRPAPRQAAPPKVRTGVTVPPGGGLHRVPEAEDLALAAMMPAVVVPPPMPRSRPHELTAPTRAEPPHAGPGTFGGPMATPTSLDGSGSGLHVTDRGAPVAPDPRDTGDAPHVGSEVGTHGAFVPRRPVPAAVLFLVPALMVGLLGSGLVWALQPDASSRAVAQPPAAEPAAQAIEPELLWVAQVNEVDPARVLPFAERHERLDRLAALPEAAFVDRRLNLAFDLVQAADAPDPCRTFAAALDAFAAAPDPSLHGALATAHAPTSDDPACAGLEARRQALLAALAPTPDDHDADAPPPEPEPTPVPEAEAPATSEAEEEPTRPHTDRSDRKRTTTKRETPAKPSTSPAATKPPMGRIDEELRPFGQ
jgi:hypothetical protein